MNKTVNINLAGIIHHLDEDAFDLLTQYLKKIKQYLNGTQGSEEIVADVESRIAEIFSERLKGGREVVSKADVAAMIAIMGAPESYKFDDDGEAGSGNAFGPAQDFIRGERKLYRNPDDKILGGVSGGIAAYFAIETVWIRLLFVVLTVISGSGILAYILLWIILPEAKTTAQKLQMRGDPVNIANIEKSIKEELGYVKKNVEEFASGPGMERTTKKMRTGVQGVVQFFVTALQRLFTFIFNVIGVLLMIFSVMALVVFLGLSTDGTFNVNEVVFSINDFKPFMQSVLLEPWQFNLIYSAVVLVIISPLIWILLLGLRILFNYRVENNYLKKSLFVLPAVGLALLIWTGVVIGRQFQAKGSFTEQVVFEANANNFTALKMNARADEDSDVPFVLDGDHVYFKFIKLDIRKAKNETRGLELQFNSRGRTTVEARENAAQVLYNYAFLDSVLVFERAFGLKDSAKFRGQTTRLTLYLPVGHKIFIDESSLPLLNDVEQAVGRKRRSELVGHTYVMTQNGLMCESCPFEEPQTEAAPSGTWEEELEAQLSDMEKDLLEAEQKLERQLEKIKQRRQQQGA